MAHKQPYSGTPFDLSGRAVLLSGACGLLGAEFARALAEGGASLLLGDLDSGRLTELAAELRKDYPQAAVETVTLDVTLASSCDAAVERSRARFGRLDSVVHNAAIDPKFDAHSDTRKYSRFTDFPLELWKQSVDVNLTGAFLLSQSACKALEERGSGSIVYLGSNYGLVGPDQRIYKKPGETTQTYKPVVYSTCKSGLLGLTRALATYYQGTAIRVNMLTPSGVLNGHDPEFVKNYSTRTLLGRMSRKEEYRAAILFLVSDASSYMTGSNLVIDGGWTEV